MTTTTRVAAAMLFLAGTAGCAILNPPGQNVDPNEPLRLYVDNQNFADATIYALFDGGIPVRLGQVSGKSKEVFTFDYRPGEISLQIRLLAGPTTTTQPIPVFPGDELDLIIPAEISAVRIP